MRFRSFALLAAGAAAVFTTLLSAAPAAAAGLNIAVAADNPPLAVVEAGEVRGFHADMVQALCAELQVECALLPLAEGELLAALEDGRADAALGIPVATAAAGEVLMTERYYKLGARFARKKGQKGRISYKRMAGKNISVVGGSLYDIFVSEKFAGARVLRYPTRAAAQQALLSGEAEYFVGSRTAQQHWTQQVEGIEVAGPNYSTAKYFSDAIIAVREEELRVQFNRAIKALRASGAYQEINGQYFPFDVYGR